MKERSRIAVALLLSLESFEGFYGGVMRLTCNEYLKTYRNDFSFVYAEALSKRGLNIFLYVPAYHCTGLHQIADRIWVRFLKVGPTYSPWRRFPALKKGALGRYIGQLANCVAFRGDLFASFGADGIDLLYVQEYWTARFDLLSLSSPIPVIGSDHGGRRYGQLTILKRKSFSHAAQITCQTENEAEAAKRFGAKAVVLPNGVDTDFFTPDELRAPAPTTILIVARLNDSQKRVSDLIRSLRYLPQEWRLQVAGTGPDELMLRDLAANLDLMKRVSFLGFVAGKSAVRDLYRNCGVYAMPSAVEGLPLAILEAMSCQCACVVSDIRAYSMIQDGVNGYKVGVGAPEQLGRAILHAYEERTSTGLHARHTIQSSFSLQRMADRLTELIETSISPDRAGA